MFDLALSKAIADKFNVKLNRIKRIEEWHRVLFVVIAGLGGRFVSKRIKDNIVQQPSINLEELKESSKEKASKDIDSYIEKMLTHVLIY